MGINSTARLAALAGAAAFVVGAIFAPQAGALMGDHSLDYTYSRRWNLDFTGPDTPSLDALYALGPCLQIAIVGAPGGTATTYVRPVSDGRTLPLAMIDTEIEGNSFAHQELFFPTFLTEYLVDGEHPLFAACTRADYEASTSTTTTSTTSPATTSPATTGPVDTDLATTTTDAEGLGATTTAPGSLPVTGRSTATGWALAVLAGGIALVVGTTRRTT